MAKLLLTLCLCVLVFLYGTAVGKWNYFPSASIQSAYNSLMGAQARKPFNYRFRKVSEGVQILVYDETKLSISCPLQTKRTGVILMFGQSNSANSAEYHYSVNELPNIFNYFDGECYQASSPLLGATNLGGEWITRTAHHLIKNGTYDEVVLISTGIDGSHIAAWTSGNALNYLLQEVVSDVLIVYSLTDVIWHQGESDLIWGTSSDNYISAFLAIRGDLARWGVSGPIFMSIASNCANDIYPNEIVSAQRLLTDVDGIELGVNTDRLVSANMRYDGCHFSFEGQEAAAVELGEIVSDFHFVGK